MDAANGYGNQQALLEFLQSGHASVEEFQRWAFELNAMFPAEISARTLSGQVMAKIEDFRGWLETLPARANHPDAFPELKTTRTRIALWVLNTALPCINQSNTEAGA